jgi:plastocyanin
MNLLFEDRLLQLNSLLLRQLTVAFLRLRDKSTNRCFMKKCYSLLCLFGCLFLHSKADVVVIEVISNQFSPANVTVQLGDEIRFHFAEGYHNAVSAGAAIPNGAAAINSGEANDAERNYDYLVTLPGVYNYYCEIHGNPNGGMRGQFTASNPLPVTLSSFLVQAQTDKMPQLSWTTLSELNVAYFSLRTSTDGVRFKEVAKIPAVGNSTSEQRYSYTDKKVSTSFHYVYYQLVVMDKDGKETFSGIRQFKTPFGAGKLVVQMGPNPIKKPGQLMLQFNAENNGIMPVNVIDASGRIVMKTTLRAVPGLNNGHVHVCDLPKGMYNLQFTFEGKQETHRVIVN